jgi:hypothetical protein
VTIPTPFTLDATSVTSTGTQLNYLNAATGTTGTTSSNVVFSASPTFTGTPTAPNLDLSGTSNQLVMQSGGVTGTLSWTPVTTNKTITLPNVTGTAEVTMATTALASGNQTITPTGSGIYTISPTGNSAITFSGTSAAIGSIVTIYISQTTTSTRNVTFPGNSREVGTLATGTTASRYFIIRFIFDGTNWTEISRTAALS